MVVQEVPYLLCLPRKSCLGHKDALTHEFFHLALLDDLCIFLLGRDVWEKNLLSILGHVRDLPALVRLFFGGNKLILSLLFKQVLDVKRVRMTARNSLLPVFLHSVFQRPFRRGQDKVLAPVLFLLTHQLAIDQVG